MGDANRIPRGLANHRHVGPHQPLGDQMAGAQVSAANLVGDGGDDHVAGEPPAGSLQAVDGEDDGRQAGLHVHGTLAVEPPALDDGSEGVADPLVSRRLHVHMAVKQQRRTAARASQPAEDTGPAGRRLDYGRLEAERPELGRHQRRHGPLVAGRIDRGRAD